MSRRSGFGAALHTMRPAKRDGRRAISFPRATPFKIGRGNVARRGSNLLAFVPPHSRPLAVLFVADSFRRSEHRCQYRSRQSARRTRTFLAVGLQRAMRHGFCSRPRQHRSDQRHRRSGLNEGRHPYCRRQKIWSAMQVARILARH